MAKHLDTGRLGEELAAEWLLAQGFVIMHKNWKHSYFELDVIASKDNILHFIEVKTRNSLAFGYPEEDVSKKKLRNLMEAAEEFLFQHDDWNWIQYDVLSIIKLKNQPVEFFLIEDVYDGEP